MTINFSLKILILRKIFYLVSLYYVEFSALYSNLGSINELCLSHMNCKLDRVLLTFKHFLVYSNQKLQWKLNNIYICNLMLNIHKHNGLGHTIAIYM